MLIEQLSSILSSFSLVALAEIGDKSQLVCMALATRYRHWPVFWGAVLAFLVLNGLAVTLGATVAAWVPESVLAGIVALMFLIFGIQTFLSADEEDDPELVKAAGHGIFITTLLMIFLSEFGDKTQIAVAGLSTTLSPFAVWLGASIALIMTSGLGIWLGKHLLKKLPLRVLTRVGGVVFILFAAFAGYRAVTSL